MRETTHSMLKDVWEHEISRDYSSSHIVSERELQAALYFHLRRRLEKENVGDLRIFIEPTIRSESENTHPDVFIASSTRSSSNRCDIVAVVELKLQRGRHLYIKFEEELRRIMKRGASECVAIADQRPVAQAADICLRFTPDTLFYMGFIGSTGGEASSLAGMAKRKLGLELSCSPELAARTCLLYGNVDEDGSVNFGVEWWPGCDAPFADPEPSRN